MKNYEAGKTLRARASNVDVAPHEIEALVGRLSETKSAYALQERQHNRAHIASWLGQRLKGMGLVLVSPSPRGLTAQQGASRLADWMREHGFVGEFTHDKMREFAAWWHEDENVAPIPIEALLKEFSRALGVRKNRPRRKDLNPHGNNKVTLYLVMERVSPLVRPKAEPERIRLAA